jgi:hypothetical protein
VAYEKGETYQTVNIRHYKKERDSGIPVLDNNVSWQAVTKFREKQTPPSIRVGGTDFCFETHFYIFHMIE